MLRGVQGWHAFWYICTPHEVAMLSIWFVCAPPQEQDVCRAACSIFLIPEAYCIAAVIYFS
jgi:hypothetical protein